MTRDEIDALAHEIALDAARSDVECGCLMVRGGRHDWYDTQQSAHGGVDEFLPRSLAYLEARGVLIRDRERPYVVAFEDDR